VRGRSRKLTCSFEFSSIVWLALSLAY
jgi:hypothetical protein